MEDFSIREENLLSAEEIAELDQDEVSTLDFLSKAALDGLSLSALATITADEIFGEQIDKDDDQLFLAAMIDETQPLQSELVAKLGAMYDANGFLDPDRYSMQIFKRNAGFTPQDERLAKSVTRDPENTSKSDLYDLGQYCSAVCLKDFQVVVFGREEHVLSSGLISPVFELKPHPDPSKKNTQPDLLCHVNGLRSNCQMV